MKKFLIAVIIIAVLAGLGFIIYKIGVPYYQDHFTPESKKVYKWTDENGVVHFSDSPIYVTNPDEVKKVPEVEVKRFKDYGKDKYIIEKDKEAPAGKSKDESSSSRK